MVDGADEPAKELGRGDTIAAARVDGAKRLGQIAEETFVRYCALQRMLIELLPDDNDDAPAASGAVFMMRDMENSLFQMSCTLGELPAALTMEEPPEEAPNTRLAAAAVSHDAATSRSATDLPLAGGPEVFGDARVS